MLNLNKLSELARDGSKGARKNLVGALTDIFMSVDDDHVEHISLLFGDIVLKVLGQLELEARMALSKRVCHHEQAPHELMVELASDEIEVALPVLENSPVLTAEDLAKIASNGSQDHLSAIAGRSDLTPIVTSEIVSRGDAKVLAEVAGNQSAEFANVTLDRLADAAANEPMIQEALIERDDLTEESAHRLVPFLTDELRKRVQAMGGDTTLVKVMAERAAAEVKAQMKSLGRTKVNSAAMIHDVVKGKRKLDDAVVFFAKRNRAADLSLLLAKASGMPPNSVSRLVYSIEDKPLIILCRAIGVSDAAYKNVVTMRATRLNMAGRDVNEAIRRYSYVGKNEAKRSLEAIRSKAGIE